MSRCRVVVLSSTASGHRCLAEAFADAPGITVAGVITTPADIQISYAPTGVNVATHATFSDLAGVLGFELEELRGRVTAESYLTPLRRWRPDVILALGWYYIVPARVRAAARACLGIHASLLPKYRGGAPIAWAIINGERETGVTLFHLDDGVDSGDIVAQARIGIDDRETCATLFDKVTDASVDLLRQMLPLIAAGTAPRQPQRHALATTLPQRRPNDGRIDWSWPAERIDRFVRAQTRPYPGAFTTLDDERVTIWSAVPSREWAGDAGVFGLVDGRMTVGCGEGSLLVTDFEVEGTPGVARDFVARRGASRGQFAPS
jgi:methionyl-tRNA formyltransferase